MTFEEYRKQFPVTEKCTYMDVAYDCGGTIIGKKAAQRYFEDWQISAAENERGGPGRGVFFRTLDETRNDLNTLIHGEGKDQIAFTHNTNEGINAILQGFDFLPGDNIVLHEVEHPSVMMPALNAHHTKGVEVRIAKMKSDYQVHPQDLIELCDSHTKMILVSHVQSATGTCIDLNELGNYCHKHGIFLIVDAIQSVGIKPVDVLKAHVSALSAGTYKGLSGSESTAFLYAEKELLKHIWPVYTAAGFYMSVQNEQLICKDETHARKLENSSLDYLGCYVLHDALKEIMNLGIDNIWNHINVLYHQLYDGLKAQGFTIITAKEDIAHAGSLTLLVNNPQHLWQYLRDNNIVLSLNSGKYIRLSIGAFNNQQDIEHVLKVTKEWKEKDC